MLLTFIYVTKINVKNKLLQYDNFTIIIFY